MIDIDRSGAVVSELSGQVILDGSGRPLLQPWPGEGPRWNAVLARHAHKGQLCITLSRIHERRSNQQNRLLWLVYTQILAGLRELADEAGERCPFKTTQDLHEGLKYVFLGTQVVHVGGTEMEVPSSTTKLSTEQFSTYLQKCIEWASARKIFVEMDAA